MPAILPCPIKPGWDDWQHPKRVCVAGYETPVMHLTIADMVIKVNCVKNVLAFLREAGPIAEEDVVLESYHDTSTSMHHVIYTHPGFDLLPFIRRVEAVGTLEFWNGSSWEPLLDK